MKRIILTTLFCVFALNSSLRADEVNPSETTPWVRQTTANIVRSALWAAGALYMSTIASSNLQNTFSSFKNGNILQASFWSLCTAAAVTLTVKSAKYATHHAIVGLNNLEGQGNELSQEDKEEVEDASKILTCYRVCLPQ